MKTRYLYILIIGVGNIGSSCLFPYVTNLQHISRGTMQELNTFSVEIGQLLLISNNMEQLQLNRLSVKFSGIQYTERWIRFQNELVCILQIDYLTAVVSMMSPWASVETTREIHLWIFSMLCLWNVLCCILLEIKLLLILRFSTLLVWVSSPSRKGKQSSHFGRKPQGWLSANSNF